MLVALRIDTDRCNQEQIFVHVNAIDLDHQQIEAGEIGCHPILHARRRQRYEAAGGGRFRQTSPPRPRDVSPRQPNPTGKIARRDIDQQPGHGPPPQPALPHCPPPPPDTPPPPRKSRDALAARFQSGRRGSRSCPSFPPSGAPAGHDLAHAVDHRLLAHRDPSSRQGPPCRKPNKTTRSSPKSSTGPQASAL